MSSLIPFILIQSTISFAETANLLLSGRRIDDTALFYNTTVRAPIASANIQRTRVFMLDNTSSDDTCHLIINAS